MQEFYRIPAAMCVFIAVFTFCIPKTLIIMRSLNQVMSISRRLQDYSFLEFHIFTI